MRVELGGTSIKIEGHVGKWYVLSSRKMCSVRNQVFEELYLLEHETYGDEAHALIVDGDGNIILDDVSDGWEELEFRE